MQASKVAIPQSMDEFVPLSAIEHFWQCLAGKRRNFLVNPSYQLRVGLVSLAFVATLLVPLHVAYYFVLTTDSQSLREVTELRAFLAAQDAAQFRLVLLGTVAFLLGFFLLSILETHRTAGAAHNLARQMHKVEQGRLDVTMVLRKEDHLRELEASFNDMTASLRDRARMEVEQLEALADRLANVRDDGTVREVSSRLRLLAEAREKALS